MDNQHSMIFGSAHDLLLSVHARQQTHEAEWRRYRAELRRVRDRLCGVVVLQLSGSPGLWRWRQLLRSFSGQRRPRVAFLTEAPWRRAVIAALSFFSELEVAAYSPDDLRGALGFVLQGEGALLHDDVADKLRMLRETLAARGRLLH